MAGNSGDRDAGQYISLPGSPRLLKDSTAVATGSLDRIELYLNTTQSLSGSPTLIGTIHRSKSQYPVEAGPDSWYQYSFDIGTGINGSRYLIVKALNLTWNFFGNDMCFDHLELLEESAVVPPQAPVSPRPENEPH